MSADSDAMNKLGKSSLYLSQKSHSSIILPSTGIHDQNYFYIESVLFALES
jgi:hypothetical protein